jgi:hypothetical protein
MYIYDRKLVPWCDQEEVMWRSAQRDLYCRSRVVRSVSEGVRNGNPDLLRSESLGRSWARILRRTERWEMGGLGEKGSPTQTKFAVFSLPRMADKVPDDKTLLTELGKMKTTEARALARAFASFGKPKQFTEALIATLQAIPLPGEGLKRYAIYLARIGAEAFILRLNVTGDKRSHVGFVDHPSRLYDSFNLTHREYFLHFAIRRLLVDSSSASTPEAHGRVLALSMALFSAVQSELAREFRLIGIPENLLIAYRRLVAAIMWKHYQLQTDGLLERTRSLKLRFADALKQVEDLFGKASITLLHDVNATLPIFHTGSGAYRDYFTPSGRTDIGFTHFSRFARSGAESEPTVSFRTVVRRRYEQKSLLEELQRRSHPALPPLLHDTALWQLWLRRIWDSPLLQRDKLGDLLGLVHRYFEAFTVHVPHDLREGCSEKNYLTRSFPRAVTGALIHDCAVYAIRWLHMLGGLFTGGLTPYGIANPRAYLVEMPSHVGAMIRVEFGRPFLHRHVLVSINNKDAVVHSDNPQESDQDAAGVVVLDRYKGVVTPYFLRPIKSRLSDANALWKEVCRIFETKLRLPYPDPTEPHLRYLAYNAGIAGVSREVADAVGGLWLDLQRRLASARNESGTIPSDRLREEIQRYAQSVKATVDAGTKKYKKEVEPLSGEIDRDLDANKHRIPRGARIVDSAQPPRQPWESAWRDYSQELEKSVKSLDLSQSNPERFFPEDDFVAAVE